MTYDRSVVFSGYFGFLHQQNRLPRYNWNIVESDVKHHNPIWNKVIGGVMVSMLASSAVNSRFKPRSGQTKDLALKSKNKD